MQFSKNILFSFLLILLLGNLYAQTSLDTSNAMAQDAVRRLEEALGGAGTAQNTAPVQATRGGSQPRWVNDPYTAYSRDQYIAAVGHGNNRANAERDAFAKLTAVFGQSIQSDFSMVSMYSEAVTQGIVTASENTNVRETIATAASLDVLVGAQIGYVWEDPRGLTYALAYIDKAKTVAIYTEMIRMNLANIQSLLTMTNAEKNTFNGIARYKLAAVISDINAKYANVVAQAGGPTASALNLTNADAINIEASKILENITVLVRVNNDRGNRIRDVFTRVLNGEGLRTRGNNPPYTLDVTVNFEQASFPNNNNIFCRFSVSAELIENSTNAILFAFNYSDRAGHSTYENAVNTAVIMIERRINEQYPAAFKGYLATQLPE